MSEQKVKRRINKFSFDKDAMMNGANVHVALVDKAANLTEVLVMKSAPISNDTNTNTEVTKSEEITMDIKEEAKPQVEDTTKAELDTLKAQLAEMEVMKAQLAELDDLRKAAQELRDVKKAQQEKELAELTEVVKGYNLFEEEGDVALVAKFFQDHACNESALILKALEKARDSVKAFGEAEHGTELKPQEDLHKSNSELLTTSVAEILKSRKRG